MEVRIQRDHLIDKLTTLGFHEASAQTALLNATLFGYCSLQKPEAEQYYLYAVDVFCEYFALVDAEEHFEPEEFLANRISHECEDAAKLDEKDWLRKNGVKSY